MEYGTVENATLYKIFLWNVFLHRRIFQELREAAKKVIY